MCNFNSLIGKGIRSYVIEYVYYEVRVENICNIGIIVYVDVGKIMIMECMFYYSGCIRYIGSMFWIILFIFWW